MSAVSKISIDTLGLHLLEPQTFISNLVLGAVSFYAYYWLSRAQPNHQSSRHWRVFFLFQAICYLLGSFGHLLFYYTGIYLKMVSWFALLISLRSLTLGCLEMMGIEQKRKTSLLVNLVFWISVLAMILLQNFSFIGIMSGLAFLVILPIGSYNAIYVSVDERSRAWSVLCSFSFLASAVIFAIGWDPNPIFNRLELAHLFLVFGVWSLYRFLKLSLYNESQ